MKKINKKTLTVSLAIIAAVCVIFGIVLLLASPKSGGSANIAKTRATRTKGCAS